MAVEQDQNQQIINYVDKCFHDAFASEGKEYNTDHFMFRFFIVSDLVNHKDILYPIRLWCKYNRVERRVRYRLENNLEKNMGLHFIRTDEIAIMDYEYPKNCSLDPNHYICFISVDLGKKTKQFYISAVNRDYETGVDFDKVIPAKKLYSLVKSYHNINDDEIKRIKETFGEHPMLYLPNEVLGSYHEFEELHKKTFGYLPSEGYQIIPGPGVKIMSNQ